MSKVEPTYRWSRAEAEANGETILWLESYRVNCACARFIEKQISANYADNRLNEQGVKTAIKKYGFDRVNRVLANTVDLGMTDGRYCKAIKNGRKVLQFRKKNGDTVIIIR